MAEANGKGASALKVSDVISQPFTPIANRKPADNLRPEIRDEIVRIEIEEQTLLAKKQAFETKHRQLMEQKAAFEAMVTKEQDEKQKLRLIHDDICALESLKSKIPKVKNLGTEVVLNGQIEATLHDLNEREALGLLALAKRRQNKRAFYVSLSSMLLFFVLYSSMLLTQRDQNTAFNVETRCQDM